MKLAFVFAPAIAMASFARVLDDRYLSGAGTAWYEQDRSVAGWLFVGAIAWLVISFVVVWLNKTRQRQQ